MVGGAPATDQVETGGEAGPGVDQAPGHGRHQAQLGSVHGNVLTFQLSVIMSSFNFQVNALIFTQSRHPLSLKKLMFMSHLAKMEENLSN